MRFSTSWIRQSRLAGGFAHRPLRLRLAALTLATLGLGTLVSGLWRSFQAERVLHDSRPPGSTLSAAQPLRELVQDALRLTIHFGAHDDGNRALARLHNLDDEGRRFLSHLAATTNPDRGDTSVFDPTKLHLLQSRWHALMVDCDGLLKQAGQLTGEARDHRVAALGQTAASVEASLDGWVSAKESENWQRVLYRFRDATPLFHWIGGLAILMAACLGLYGESMRVDDEIESPAERRRRLERLQLLEDAADHGPAALHRIDAHGAIVWSNVAARRLLGRSGSESTERLLRELFVEPAVADEFLRRARSGDTVVGFSASWRTDDGATRHVVLDTQPVFVNGKLSHTWCAASDVTGKLRIEDAYRAGERRLQAILRQSPSGTFLATADGRYTFVSDRVLELTGMSAERVASNWADAIHPDDRARVVDAWQRAVGTGREFDQEYRFVRPDGSVVWVAGRSVPLRDDAGAVIEHVGTVTDVTRLKHSEEEHRAGEQRFRKMADDAPVVIWKSDADGRNLFVNRRWLDFRGTTLEQEREFGWTKALHPDDREAALAVCRAARDAKTGFTIQYRALRHDGVYRWMLDSGTPEFDAAGRLIGYLGTCVDITEQKEAEERIRRSEERLELAMSGSNEVLFDWNITTGECYHSPRMADILGYYTEEIPGRIEWFRQSIHEQDREQTWNALRTHLTDGTPYAAEFRLRTMSGDYRWFLARGKAIRNERGEPVRMAGAATDITEQKRQRDELVRLALDATESSRRMEEQAQEVARQAEELHAANEKAQAATKAKGEFLANMSHEIRTPLNAILGMTELALDGQLSDDQRDLLKTVHTSGEHLLSLINDILDFSKIEAGKLTLEAIEFDLKECVDLSAQLFAITARSKGLELRTALGEGVPARLKGDVGRLRQILVNLIGNAIKFTPTGGVTTDVRLVSTNERGVRLHFVVTDTGIGIPADKLDAIFRPFEQADGSTTRQFGGTGLGLSIVRRLVEMMNGRIWVESEVGKGSRFQFEVELMVAEEALAPAVKSTGAEFAGAALPPLRVLVAEDNVMNQKLIVRLLEGAGHTVTLATDGRAALESATRDAFDVVLMDMMMPGMSGVEATVAIRDWERRSQKRRVPIVALTANAMQGDREVCLEAGMDGYAAKPIRREQLFGEMARVLFESRATLESGLCVDMLMTRVENDTELLGDMIALFDEMAPALVDSLVAAARDNRADDVRQLAHKLRGSVGLFGPSHAQAALEAIESAARAVPPTVDPAATEAAHRHVDALLHDLKALVAVSAKPVPVMA